MTFRFAHPEAFQILWLLGLLLLFTVWTWKKQSAVLKQSIDARLLPFLTESFSKLRRRIKLTLQSVVFILFIIALARPQSVELKEKVKSEGVELMILVDVSQSMEAEDVKPSRLELAKREISHLLDLSIGDRVGLIAFAGSAILLSPMTTDRNALKMYVESLSPQSVSEQGTEFRKALKEAEQAFSRGGVEGGENSVTTRAIVIVSDGEDQEPGATDSAKKLVDKGIRIFSLIVGTEKGAPIPVRDDHGSLQGYLKDSKGQVVLTQTKGSALQSLAEAGRGSFHQLVFGGTSIKALNEDLQRLQKSVFDQTELTVYNERYQPFLFFGFLIALLEFIFAERAQRNKIWRGRFEVKK